MNCKKLITMATTYSGISLTELAHRLNMSPQALNTRLNTGKFSIEEWQNIAAAVGADPESVICFTFPDGKKIY